MKKIAKTVVVSVVFLSVLALGFKSEARERDVWTALGVIVAAPMVLKTMEGVFCPPPQPVYGYGSPVGQLSPREESYRREAMRLQREAEYKWIHAEREAGRQQARDDFHGRY